MAQVELRFAFDEVKGLEALTYVAARWPGITVFFASKVLFFAEKHHLNRYGRPITADTFMALPNGPVPAVLYDFIQGRLDQAGDPETVVRAISVRRAPWPSITALREADRDVLSPSDMECLDEALNLCRALDFAALSRLTHLERAWSEAPAGGPMDYEAMIDLDNPHREAILEEAKEFATFGVL